MGSGKVERWTTSETGGLNTSTFAEPQLIKWQTFDGKTISGFLYMPDAKRFPGKRPVIVKFMAVRKDNPAQDFWVATISILTSWAWR